MLDLRTTEAVGREVRLPGLVERGLLEFMSKEAEWGFLVNHVDGVVGSPHGGEPLQVCEDGSPEQVRTTH
jgi:hypothetical protein